MYYAFEGYFDKRQGMESMFRNVAFITHRSMSGKESIDRMWPIGKKKREPEKIVMSDEIREQVMKVWGLNPNKFKKPVINN